LYRYASAGPGARGNLSAFILMQRIFPPTNTTLCLRAVGAEHKLNP
jgi:hypothetical protein